MISESQAIRLNRPNNVPMSLWVPRINNFLRAFCKVNDLTFVGVSEVIEDRAAKATYDSLYRDCTPYTVLYELEYR